MTRAGANLWGDRVLLGITILVAVLWMLPVIWVVAMSLKPNEVLQRSTWGFFPYPFTLENYVDLFRLATVPRWLLNSLVVAVSMTLFVLVVSSLAGYAFARLRFPFKRTLFILMIAGRVSRALTLLIVCANAGPSAATTDALTTGATFWKPNSFLVSVSTVYLPLCSCGSVVKIVPTLTCPESSAL